MKSLLVLVLLSSPAMADLAKEKISGNVLVRSGAKLHASLAAARADVATPKGVPIAMRVIRDHGDVVELSTARVDDCAGGFEKPYELTVFVKRAMLYARAKVEVVKTFADGTAVAIDRGTAVDGGAWVTPSFAETRVPPPAELAYGLPGKLPSAKLLPPLGEPLVCDRGGPQTKQEWTANRERVREAEERTAAERRKRDAQRNQKMPPNPDVADLLTDMSDRKPGISLDQAYAPPCGVANRAPYASRATTPPTIDGVNVSFPIHASPLKNEHVVKQGTQYLGEIVYRCGRTRVLVTNEGVGPTDGGAGMGGGGEVQLWVPKPGKVTWPDGRAAGTYSGNKRYADATEMDDRICVRVDNVAEHVCHPRKTTKTEMGSRYRSD